MRVIRPFGLRDAWAIKHLQPRGVAFGLRRLLGSSSPVSSAVLGLLTRRLLGALTLVYYGPKRSNVRGFAQLEPRRDGQAWDLTFLAPSLDERQALPCIWQDLLAYAVVAAAQQQALRLYARPPQDSEIEQLLRRAGFALVTREEVFALSEPPPPAALPRGFREADRQDAWALSELYRKAIPPLAYQAQGPVQLGSLGLSSGLGSRPAGYVWTEKGEIVAHLTLSALPRGYWIECAVHADYRGELLPYIAYLISLTDCSPSRPAYLAVPDYNVGLGWLLRTLGFVSYSRQLVMVAHTANRVSVARPIAASSRESTVDMATPVSAPRGVGGGRGQGDSSRGHLKAMSPGVVFAALTPTRENTNR
jgi:hypothetical protein